MLLSFKNTAVLKITLIISILISISFSQNGKVDYNGQVKNNYVINGQEYIASDDGTLMMYVNIWGHVKTPGTYLVYEGIDLLTLISLAGGPQSGANLNNVEIIHDKSTSPITKINLNKYINSDKTDIVIKPHDTIYIKESMSSYLFTKVNLLNTLLQIVNISYTISRLP